MDVIQVEAFVKSAFDDQGKTIQVGVICIQAPRTTSLADYARSKEMLENTFNVTIIKETVHEMSSMMNPSLKGIQLIVLHIKRNKDT